MSKSWIIYKKLHKWPGLVLSFILFYYAISGIIMNHREVFSGIDINRNILPGQYKYENWNNAALKGNLILNNDSILVYGNIGIWLTDSAFKDFISFNAGFPAGSDNRKIFDVHKTPNGELYAATLFGLYSYSRNMQKWNKLNPGNDNERFVGIESIEDTLYVINRSCLFKGKSEGDKTKFSKIELRTPKGFENKVTLFRTIWQIHSGEIFGLPGKLYVDLLGIITAFLSITGIIYFFFPGWIKQRFKRNRPAAKIIRINKWSLKWHNKLGAWTFILLIILFFTGMFLRPPLLLAIAKTNIAPLRYSQLDQPNPWYDKLRDILFDEERHLFLLSTLDGMYFMDTKELLPVRFKNQPPVSVMGINTFEHFGEDVFLIGSFSGLFLWHPRHSEIYNYAKGTIYRENMSGRPVGDFKITGTLSDIHGKQYMVDYDKGIVPLRHKGNFPEMPQNILNESKMSLWNVCLEIHTGRIFEGILGLFYILLVPVIGIAAIIIVISGYLLWKKKYKNKN
jgi:hypothetical protein